MSAKKAANPTARNVSEAEAVRMASDFSKAASAVGDHVSRNLGTLSREEVDLLLEKQNELFGKAQELREQAVLLILRDARADLALIREATQGARNAVRNMRNVASVISLITGVVDLALAVSTGNLDDALRAARATANLTTELTGRD
jgi:hypothetical protein